LTGWWSLNKATGFLRMIDQLAVWAYLQLPVDNPQTIVFRFR
jgi:hypothetical protein